jgi:dTDP-4-amino-4,6-dideoxygalactose transaminase
MDSRLRGNDSYEMASKKVYNAQMPDYYRRKYEDAFAEFKNARGAKAFALGRHALAILLKSLNIKPGDKVGVCAFTCLAVVEAIKVCQAIPIYLDIDEHLCIDPSEIRIHDKGSLRAVILQHTFGNPGRFEELLAACKKNDTTIIEDCAHSLHSAWNGRKLGTSGVGAVCQGGMLTVNSNELLDKIDEQIKLLARPTSTQSELLPALWHSLYRPFHHTRIDCFLGYQYSRLRGLIHSGGRSFLKDGFSALAGFPRLSGEMKAKAGLTQLQNQQKIQQVRLENTAMIERYFSEAGLSLCPRQPKAELSLMRYPLRVFKKWEKVHKGGIRGLDIAGWYNSPIHPLTGDDFIKVNYKVGSCPHSEGTIERLIHLPTDEAMNEQKLEEIVKILNGGS